MNWNAMLKRIAAMVLVIILVMPINPIDAENGGGNTFYSDWWKPAQVQTPEHTFSGVGDSILLSYLMALNGIYGTVLDASADTDAVELDDSLTLSAAGYFDSADLHVTTDRGEYTIVLHNPAPGGEIPAGSVVSGAGGSFKASAPVPEGTELVLGAFNPSDSLRAAIPQDAGEKTVWMEISLLTPDGQSVETGAEVTVKTQIELPAPEAMQGLDGVATVKNARLFHVTGRDAVEEVPVEVETEGGVITALRFATASFSGFALSYTVDFHYILDGDPREISFSGGGAVSFTDLMGELGLYQAAGFDTAADFAAEVSDVTFSDPSLLWIGKAGTDTTVGALIAANGLTPQYSQELAEEDIQAIHAIPVRAGDWALISLLPFVTEEQLTMTMKNGDVYTVRVTDAQIQTHVITADGIGYTITVTYDEAAGIPDNAILVAREITLEDKGYQDYWEAADEYLAGMDDDVGLFGARFFDISIVVNDQKIEPKTAVEVKIEQDDPVQITDDGELRIIHFSNHGIEMIDDLSINENATTIIYRQDSFSIIGEVSVTNAYGWPVVNGEYVLVFEDTANGKYYALGTDLTLREVRVSGQTVVFLGEGTTDLTYLNNYTWYLWGLGSDNRKRAYLSTGYYPGQGSTADSGTFIDPTNTTGFSTSARGLYFNVDNNLIYSSYYSNSYTLSVKNGNLSRVQTTDAAASPVLFARVSDFIANSSESDQFTQIDVESLITKFSRQMTQELITEKTATVQDYSNRLYKVDINASSGYYEISPSIHLEFVVDASRSMYFPTSLDLEGSLGGTQRSDLVTWLNKNGDVNKTYFVIADPNGAATVFAVFRRNNAWYYVDASNFNPPDGEVYEGTLLSNWNVANLDGNIYTTEITDSTYTTYGWRNKWVSRIEYLKQAVKAAAQVIYAVDANAKLGLVTFNSDPYDKGTFTKDQASQFYQALESISLAGGTNQRDGLQKAIDKFNADTDKNEEQLIALLITDGAPNWKVNGKQVANATAWKEIGQKAATLKALQDGDGTAELFCLGLSLENVGTNKSSLFGVSSGSGYNYNAEDAAAIVDCISQIVKNVVLQANLIGRVTDVIDSAFYPVAKDGTPLQDGEWITLNGEKVPAGHSDAAGQLHYNSDSETWTVNWNNQIFDWPQRDSAGNIIGSGWHGALYLKAKEDFLGGNLINTNASGSQVTPEKYISRNGREIPIEGEGHTIILDTPYVNVDELAFTSNESEWTVHLGTSVDPWYELHELLKAVEVQEVVSETVQSNHKTISSRDSMLGGTTEQSETFPLTEIIGALSAQQITELKAGNAVTIPYNNEIDSAYGHGNVGTIVLKLTKNENGSYSEHETTGVGYPWETYTLTVTYTPSTESARDTELNIDKTIPDPYHNGSGSRGSTADPIVSSNQHIINVFAEKLRKTDPNGNVLPGAVFGIYRTARAGDDTAQQKIIDGNTYTLIKTVDISETSEGWISAVPTLTEGEECYLVELQRPAGYQWAEPEPLTLTFIDRYIPLPGTTEQETKPASGIYNWIQTVTGATGSAWSQDEDGIYVLTVRDDYQEISVPVAGQKVLKGRELTKRDLFEFLMEPAEPVTDQYPGLPADNRLITNNQADGVFRFDLQYSYADYLAWKTEEDTAVFTYQLTEIAPETVDPETHFDENSSIYYSTAVYWVQVTLWLDENGELQISRTVYTTNPLVEEFDDSMTV